MKLQEELFEAAESNYEKVMNYINRFSLTEDTEKTKSGKWVNRGKEGTHGEFRTKKAADAQRRAMFAQGYKTEALNEARSTKLQELIIKRAQEADKETKDKIIKEFTSPSTHEDDIKDLQALLNGVDIKWYWMLDTIVRDNIIDSILSVMTNKKIEEAKEPEKCALCGEEIKGYGNNGQPLVNGLVCDKCNEEKVIPERLKRMKDNFKTESLDDNYFCVLTNKNHNPVLFIGENGSVTEPKDAKKFKTYAEAKEELKGVPTGFEIREIVDENKFLAESIQDKHLGTETNISQENLSDTGLSTMVNALISDELEAIDGYNSAIVTFETEGKSDYTNIMRDIINEEQTHIGQLQKILDELKAGTIQNIKDGQIEAGEQLAETETPIDENVESNKKIIENSDNNYKSVIVKDPSRDAEYYFNLVDISLSETDLNGYIKYCITDSGFDANHFQELVDCERINDDNDLVRPIYIYTLYNKYYR